jgi:hypothetical protein
VKALYRLSNKIAGFDFYLWLVMQAQAGATEIVFDTASPSTGKWPLRTVMRRFESILWPGPALLGLKCKLGTDGNPKLAPYHQSEMVKLCHQGITFPRLKSVLPPGNERYTVTLRKTQRNLGRNSDEAAWRAFAAEIGARVIPDYDDEPLHLHERMALYAGAEMNFFVTNGPVILCFLSDYPAMSFDCQNSPMTHIGIPLGQKYPFCLPQHQQIYEAPTPEAIRRHFDLWRSGESLAA